MNAHDILMNKFPQKDDSGRLSKTQIENWRKVLTLTIGPVAMFLPDADIQKIRDSMQRELGE